MKTTPDLLISDYIRQYINKVYISYTPSAHHEVNAANIEIPPRIPRDRKEKNKGKKPFNIRLYQTMY